MENGWIIGMQPPAATVPSWVSWYRHVRPEHRPPARASPRARPSSFALYFNSRNEPIRVDRIDGLLYPKLPTLPPLGKAWATGAPWAPRVPFDMFELAVPFDHAAWRRPAQPPDIITEITLNHHQLSPAGGGGGAGGGGWSLAARGWAAGAALLVLLALVVRAAERCIDSKLFKVRRRDSEEWPTATVMATSVQNDNMEAGLPRLDDSFSEPSVALNDLPPPYSECATNMLANKRDLTEEPPPPYSACYVSFTNPKDGPPSVHIHRRPAGYDRQPHTSTEADNQHNTDTTASSYNDIIDDEIRTELVFENGRVVERVSLNPNINTLEVSIDNVLENRNININSVASDSTNTTNNEPAQSNGNNTTEREIMV